ncbi:MAG: hypothetical protein QM756_07595 [Polyangiaceae bacterium]
MIRTTSLFVLGLAFAASACGADKDRAAVEPDCGVTDAYDFLTYSDFNAGIQWYQYADATPGGVPNISDPAVGSNLKVTHVPTPGRCNDTGMLRLVAYGHNFYGAGFGDYGHNDGSARADATGYDGISFWIRAGASSDTTFLFYVDDGRTIVYPPTDCDDPLTIGVTEACSETRLPEATALDQDLDGDGFVGPGDIARGTQCRLPPPQSLGRAACYAGGTQPPATATRVPEPDECGNQFHTYVTATQNWQFIRIPWSQLVQWPCPNRLDGGINPADIGKIEIKFLQGTNYDIWLDNIAFYRLKTDGG